MFRIAICDDNVSVCSEIENMIIDYEKISTVKMEVDIFYSGESLIDFIKNDHGFDLIFLDIEMRSISGIEVGRKIRKEFDDYISKIVFVTSKNGYERKLFEVQPLNFIPKPVEKERVVDCIELAMKILNIGRRKFEYKKGYNVIKVDIKDILYFESKRKQVRIVTKLGEDVFYGTLDGVKEKLPKTFVEPHGSFLVNFDMVERINNDKIIMINGTELPISQRHLKNIRSLLIDFEREKN